MPTSTRSSTRIAANSSPKEDEKAEAGTKRKTHTSSSPSSKPAKKAPKKQTTIEETIAQEERENVSKDVEMKDEVSEEGKNDIAPPSKETDKQEFKGEAGSDAQGNGAIEESSQREKQLPSNILEKGIVYFFTRNRVGVEEAESVGDLQRTYFVLRPLPVGAKLGDGAIPDEKNNRLFALPKKAFPKRHSDRFMAFVEKANTSIQDLKDNFFQGSEYETQTSGTRHIEPITPVGEGVYAITRTEDRTTHFVYMLTIPSEIGEVQQDLGLRSQGSFIMSVKNPERPGPASARLPQAPEYPKEFLDEFRGLAWTEVKPKYIDYPNAQILLIGEGDENNLGKAVEPTTKDKKHDKETPQEELEKLEHEDELRTEHLKGDDSIFEDLKISKKDYPEVPTTW